VYQTCISGLGSFGGMSVNDKRPIRIGKLVGTKESLVTKKNREE